MSYILGFTPKMKKAMLMLEIKEDSKLFIIVCKVIFKELLDRIELALIN
jgi:hypothetical protein